MLLCSLALYLPMVDNNNNNNATLLVIKTNIQEVHISELKIKSIIVLSNEIEVTNYESQLIVCFSLHSTTVDRMLDVNEEISSISLNA